MKVNEGEKKMKKVKYLALVLFAFLLVACNDTASSEPKKTPSESSKEEKTEKGLPDPYYYADKIRGKWEGVFVERDSENGDKGEEIPAIFEFDFDYLTTGPLENDSNSLEGQSVEYGIIDFLFYVKYDDSEDAYYEIIPKDDGKFYFRSLHENRVEVKLTKKISE